MRTDDLDNKDEKFWGRVKNAKTDHVIIFMILSELRQCDPLGESNQVKMGRLSKMKALSELLDMESIYKKTKTIVDPDDELLDSMNED